MPYIRKTFDEYLVQQQFPWRKNQTSWHSIYSLPSQEAAQRVVDIGMSTDTNLRLRIKVRRVKYPPQPTLPLFDSQSDL